MSCYYFSKFRALTLGFFNVVENFGQTISVGIWGGVSGNIWGRNFGQQFGAARWGNIVRQPFGAAF